MYRSTMTLALLLVMILPCCHGMAEEDMSMVEWLMEAVDGNEELICDHLSPYLGSEGEAVLNEFLYQRDNETEGPGAGCRACTAAIATLKFLIRDEDWETVRNFTLELCLDLGEELGMPVEDLCPGIVDHQGPHLFYILAPEQNVSAELACEALVMCFPPEEDKHRTSKRVKAPPVNRPNRSQGQDNLISIVHLTDIHIEPEYTEGSETDCGLPSCCWEKYGPGSAGEWGDYSCNIPPKTMDLFLRKIAEWEPDFVIYSGDTPPHSMWEETYESQMNCTRRLVDNIHQALEGYNVYPNIGNHEMYPTNLYYIPLEETQNANQLFVDLWRDLAKFEEQQIDTMLAGGYFSVQALPGLRILSYNGNYGYGFNFYNALNFEREELEEMFNYMEGELAAARENGDKVIVVSHHPIQGMIARHGRRLNRMMVEYSDVIIMHLSGHTHSDHFHIFKDADEDAAAVATSFTAPCANTRGNKNPTVRIFYLDADTYELVDFHNYYMDIREIFFQKQQDPEIKFMYSAVEEYELEDMSAASWESLIGRFETTDDHLFQKYARNFGTRYRNEDYTCTGDCKVNHLCRMRHAIVDEWRDC